MTTDQPDAPKKKTKPRTIKRTIESDLLGILERKFVSRKLEQTYRGEVITRDVLVDVITGTQYDKRTGECLSSTRLRLVAEHVK